MKARRVPNRSWFMVWRETGAVRNARPSRGQAAAHPEEDVVKQRRRSPPFENDGFLGVGSQRRRGAGGPFGLEVYELRVLHIGG